MASRKSYRGAWRNLVLLTWIGASPPPVLGQTVGLEEPATIPIDPEESGIISPDEDRAVEREAPEDRKSRTGPIVRSRVTLAEGVLVVFEAPTDEAGHANGDGYLAYWRFPESDEVLVYAQVLLRRMDVGKALLALQRQFGVDVLLIAEASPRLGQALAEAVDQGVEPSAEWVLATRVNVNVIVGLESAKSSSGTGAEQDNQIVAQECDPCYVGIVLVEEAVEVDVAGRIALWRPVAAVVPSEEPLESGVVTEPLEEAVVTEPFPVGGDGGDAFEDGIMAACCCNPPRCPDCNDHNVCTDNLCIRTCNLAYCSFPTGLFCDDGDMCTWDWCDPVSACHFDPKDCDDNNACTTDSCDVTNGACKNLPKCGTGV
mgnify:FL=1